MIRNSKIQQLFVGLLVLLLFVPFLDKAYHIDDPVYIWVAKQILHKPLDFFGFYANWYGDVRPFVYISVSPPLFSYYLALIGALFGWAEIPMHLALIVPAIAVALGTYQLACLLKSDPLISAILAVCTPLFLVCGSSAMVDMTMTAFYVWAIYFWISGLEAENGGNYRLLSATFLIVAASLTKYFGISLIPLLAVYALWRRQPLLRWLPFLLLPIVGLVLYQYWTKYLYGFGHITHASDYAAGFKGRLKTGTLKSVVNGLSFTGGGIVIPIAFAPLLLARRFWLPLSLVLFALVLLLKSIGWSNTPTDWLLLVQQVLFVTAGIAVMAAALQSFLQDRDAGSLLLLCWIFGVFAFCTILNPFVAGRYLVPLVPAVAIIFGKRLSFNCSGAKRSLFIICLSVLTVISLLVTHADYRYANAVRTAARYALQVWAKEGGKLYFQGHWGLQYYLEEGGGVAMSQLEPQAKAGDLIVTPTFGSNVSLLDPEQVENIERINILPLGWMSAFNTNLCAGFHCSIFGQLPYAFGTVNPDYLIIQKVKLLQ